MSIKLGMRTSGIDEMMTVLEHFPELAEKHYRPAMSRDVKALESRIGQDVPIMSGRASDTFGSKVSGRGFRISGRVGWYDKGDPYYINIVEHGAKPHSLVKGTNSRTFLGKRKFESQDRSGSLAGQPVFIGGEWRTIRKHPGMAPRGFMMAGYQSSQGMIESDMFTANERILADIAAVGKGGG